MKKIIISEAKFVSLFNTDTGSGNGVFYQDGDFIVTNDRMNKHREIFNPWYDERYGRDKKKILHQLAFSETMRMIDKDEKIPEFGDSKIYNSIYGKHFSPRQVEYVENKYIIPKYGNMEIEELYDVMSIRSERNSYDSNKQMKTAVANLLNNGFFDKFLNGNVKNLALWDLGKLDDPQSYIGWLYTKNRFTKKLNRDFIIHNMEIMKDEIADSNESFMGDDRFLAFEELLSALRKLNRMGR